MAGFEVFLCVVFIIAMIVIFIFGARMIKKQKGVFAQYLASGEEEERKGDDKQAITLYKHALAIILGLEQGSAELTAKGIGMLLEQDGKKAVEKLGIVYARNGIQYAWDEFNAIVTEFHKMSVNDQLVDRNGLPKGSGKELYPILRARLKQCIASMPEINTPGIAASPVLAQPVAPAPAVVSSPAPAPSVQSVPTAAEYAAKKSPSSKRTLIIVLSVVGGLIILCLVVLCIVFVIVPLLIGNSSGVLNNVINAMGTPAP